MRWEFDLVNHITKLQEKNVLWPVAFSIPLIQVPVQFQIHSLDYLDRIRQFVFPWRGFDSIQDSLVARRRKSISIILAALPHCWIVVVCEGEF